MYFVAVFTIAISLVIHILRNRIDVEGLDEAIIVQGRQQIRRLDLLGRLLYPTMLALSLYILIILNT